jgi:hypothetical protein
MDDRTEDQKQQDEQIASGPKNPRPELTSDVSPKPIEEFFAPEDIPSPKAIVGIVENGIVKPVDSSQPLKEHSKVLIVGQW